MNPPLFEVSALKHDGRLVWCVFDRRAFTHFICSSEYHARYCESEWNRLGYRPQPQPEEEKEWA
jgi:hypothetical protein